MYERLDRSPKQNRLSRSPRQKESQRASAQADERVQTMKPPAFQSDFNLANISIDSPQPRASTPMGSQTIVLPQVLALTGCNVIGEDHFVSDDRREEEKELCYLQTGSRKYLKEYEFKEATVDSFGNVTEGREPADPWNLRMLQGIRYLMDFGIAHILKKIENETSSDPSQSHLPVAAFEDARKFIPVYVHAISHYYDELVKGRDGIKWRELNGEEAVEKLGTGLSDVNMLKQKFIQISDKLLTLPPEVTTNLLENLQDELALVEEIVIGNEKHLTFLSHDEICGERTDRMQEALNATSEQNMIVKIGQKHLMDMKASKSPIKFNMVDLKDFENLYGLYKKFMQQQSTGDNNGKSKRIESPERGKSSKVAK